MDETKEVIQDSSPEQVAQEETQEVVSEDVKTPEAGPEKKTEEKTVPFSRFKEVNDKLTQLKKQPPKIVNKSLDVEDYIDISASLEGLDQREKQFLATQHKLTGKSLSEIRKEDDFLLWQSAYRQKVEKERTLSPTGTQVESDKPMTIQEKLKRATSYAEKEKILTEAGLYKSPRPKADRFKVGEERLK
jgi:hypothetical protein